VVNYNSAKGAGKTVAGGSARSGKMEKTYLHLVVEKKKKVRWLPLGMDDGGLHTSKYLGNLKKERRGGEKIKDGAVQGVSVSGGPIPLTKLKEVPIKI